jgi:hypothetical protein
MEQYMDQEAFFTSPLRDYVTLADMSRELCVSIGLMKKLVDKNGLRPARRHGVVRLWNRADMETIRMLVERAAAAAG